MSKLSPLFEEIEKLLLVRYRDAAPTLTFGRGAKDIHASDSFPRVVWVPRQGAFSPIEKTTRKTRRITTRTLTILAHCWGADVDAASELVSEVVLALHRTAWGSLILDGEDWPEDAVTQAGVVATVGFSIRIPVEEPARDTVIPTATAWDTSDTIAGDGLLDAGET